MPKPHLKPTKKLKPTVESNEVLVTTAWLETLLRYKKGALEAVGDDWHTRVKLAGLFGYIDSAETIFLKYKNLSEVMSGRCTKEYSRCQELKKLIK